MWGFLWVEYECVCAGPGGLPRVSIRTMELIGERLLSCSASVVGFRWPTGNAWFFRRPLARADGPKMGVLTQAFLDMRRSVGQSGQRRDGFSG